MNDQIDSHQVPTDGPREPRPEVLAQIERSNDACMKAPGEIEHQIDLWKAVAALDQWICINRGTPDDPRPYALAADAGVMLCIFSTAERARESAYAGHLVEEGEPVPLFAVPLPEALDWAMSFGERGVAGVTIDHPRIGAWSPLPNLAHLRDLRTGS